MKRNVTITLDEATARWARVQAAHSDTSVSDFVGSLLRERMAADLSYERAMEAYLATPPTNLKQTGKYPRREELHERRRVR